MDNSATYSQETKEAGKGIKIAHAVYPATGRPPPSSGNRVLEPTANASLCAEIMEFSERSISSWLFLISISSCSLRSRRPCSNSSKNTTPKEGLLVSAAALFTKIETPAVSTSSRCQGTFTVIGVRVSVRARSNGVLASVRPPKGKYWDARLEFTT